MSSVDEKNSVKSKSNFNFFAILENTLYWYNIIVPV